MSLVFTAYAVGGPGPARLYVVHVPIPPEAGLAAKCSQLYPFPENFLQKQKPPGLTGYVPPSSPAPHKNPTQEQPSVDAWLVQRRQPAPASRVLFVLQSSPWGQAEARLELTAPL